MLSRDVLQARCSAVALVEGFGWALHAPPSVLWPSPFTAWWRFFCPTCRAQTSFSGLSAGINALWRSSFSVALALKRLFLFVEALACVDATRSAFQPSVGHSEIGSRFLRIGGRFKSGSRPFVAAAVISWALTSRLLGLGYISFQSLARQREHWRFGDGYAPACLARSHSVPG